MLTPVYLCILDGFAIGPDKETNAIAKAIHEGRAPFIADLLKNHPYSLLECSGRAVGLPAGTMGNSEVNHLNMGAGRVVYQSIERINVAIEDRSFFKNEALLTAVNNCLKNDSALHFMGILQGDSGTVHGEIKHLFALLELAKQQGVKKVLIHLFTDGRDTNPKAAGEIYLPRLEAKLKELGIGEISTIMGREIAMDRDTNWAKTLTAMKALVFAQGEHKESSAREAVDRSYARKETDEFIRPTIIGGYQGMSGRDSVVFFNFRQDRGMQLAIAFCERDRDLFNYKKGTAPISEELFREIEKVQAHLHGYVFVTMTEYYPKTRALTAFPERAIPRTVGEIVSNAGLRQLRLAGPEKFAHVTAWFSGRHPSPFPREERFLAQDLSLKERTENGKRYDLVPEMTAYLETDHALKAMTAREYHLIVHNFQNGDMVGHTGNLDAAAAAIGHVSTCLSKLVPAWLERGGVFVITADHGNADEMELHHQVSTQHSLNKVPLWVLGKEVKLSNSGIVPDVGTTVLNLIGLKPPVAMTARSLV